MNPAAVHDLFRAWSDTPLSPAEERLAGLVSTWLAEDGAFSNVFEPSLSEDTRGLDRFRFFFAFPALASRRDVVAARLAAIGALFGPAFCVGADAVQRAALHPAVDQLLVGYARCPTPRTKLYVQFHDGAGGAPHALAKALTGLRSEPNLAPLPLHTLGLDLGSTGLVGAKLYFRAALDADKVACLSGWRRPLPRALLIYRFLAPRTTPAAVEFNFSLAENHVAPAEIATLLSPFSLARRSLTELSTRFAVRPRSMTLGLPATRKLNLYYGVT